MTNRAQVTVYALVFPLPDGRSIHDAVLGRLAYGLWPAGFHGRVVGVLVDAGTGETEAEIRAAITVIVIDALWADKVHGAMVDHLWCEMDRVAAERERLEREFLERNDEYPLPAFPPGEISEADELAVDAAKPSHRRSLKP